MNKQTPIRLDADQMAIKMDGLRRIVQHLRDGTSDLAPAPMENPVSVYTDPERFAREKETLFRKYPLAVCLSSEIPSVGSVRQFDETGMPIVITRNKQGELRAFMNICPHRGSRLVRDEKTRSRLTCWFHAWSFDLDGNLTKVPSEEAFEGGCLNARKHLIPVPVAERHGLVFVRPDPETTMDIDAFLGDFAPQLAALKMENAELVKKGTITCNANWKYALDTYGECYHFKSLHATTLGPYFYNDVNVFDAYGPHYRIGFANVLMDAMKEQDEKDWDVDPHMGGIHHLFPNTIIFAGAVEPGKGYYTLFRHFPGPDVGTMITYKSNYAPAGIFSDTYRKEVEAAWDATAHVVKTEDYVVCEEGYKNLKALPPGATLVYGTNELAVQHMHHNFNRALES